MASGLMPALGAVLYAETAPSTGFFVQRQPAVPPQLLEVSVVREHWHTVLQRDGRDQTICRATNDVTARATASIQNGRMLERLGVNRLEHGARQQQRSYLCSMPLASTPLQHFLKHDASHGQRSAVVKLAHHGTIGCRPCGAQEFDPRRRVYQHHRRQLSLI